MSELAILVPVLARPHRVGPLLDAIRASTTAEHRVLFLTDPHDDAEIAAIDAAGAWRENVDGGYAAKINRGVELTDEPFVFLGADDLEPLPGWFEAARRRLTDGVGVVGVNDLLDRKREHATHFVLTRWDPLESTCRHASLSIL